MRFLSVLELQKSSVFFHSRNKLTLKDIHNCQYVTCMNPTAGSFTISQRLQRHFATYTVIIPSEETLFREVILQISVILIDNFWIFKSQNYVFTGSR